jgi:AAA ATPase domain
VTAEAATVVGRDVELEAVAQFVERAVDGPAVLVLLGEAGIGKSTLWSVGVGAAHARGFRALVGRPVEAETGLAFTGLADILGDVLAEVASVLPAPQLTALRIALLLEEAEGAPPDERAVGAAVRSVLSAVARRGPTLLAIDDVQWLDGASACALAFALRRVREAPPGVLLAQRSAADAAPLTGTRPGWRRDRAGGYRGARRRGAPRGGGPSSGDVAAAFGAAPGA